MSRSCMLLAEIPILTLLCEIIRQPSSLFQLRLLRSGSWPDRRFLCQVERERIHLRRKSGQWRFLERTVYDEAGPLLSTTFMEPKN